MSARNGSAAMMSSHRQTVPTATGSNVDRKDSATITAGSNIGAGAAKHQRNRPGFVSLNQPSMISDVLMNANDIEDANNQIIEEISSHAHSKRTSGRETAELI